MALTVSSPSQAASVVNFYSATLTSDAVAAVDTYINCGFKPRYIKLVNITDLATLEFVDGLAANSALQEVTAGTKSIVASAMVLDDKGVTLKAAIIPASKSFALVAFG